MEKVLSIKNPWSHLIALGIKDIENRVWPTKYRGKFYIHSSKQFAKAPKGQSLLTHHQFEKLKEFSKDETIKFLDDDYCVSAIIGEVEIIDCVQNHKSIWAEESMKEPNIDDYTLLDNGIEHIDYDSFNYANMQYEKSKPIWNWVLANPVLYEYPIFNIKGKLGLWNIDSSEYAGLPSLEKSDYTGESDDEFYLDTFSC